MLYFDFKSENITGRTTDKTKLGWTEKILLRKTGNKLIATFDNTRVFPEQSLYFIFDLKESFSYKYILSLLNSKLMTWFYLKFLVTNLDSTPQLKKVDLDKIPIKIITLEGQQPFIEKADQMLSLNRQLQEKKNKFMNRIKSNLEIEKITKKLDTFYNFDFKIFITELKKQKIKLSFNQQDEWEDYFDSYKKEINELQFHIDKTDNEIDHKINELYGLTDEEIKIVEGSCKT